MKSTSTVTSPMMEMSYPSGMAPNSMNISHDIESGKRHAEVTEMFFDTIGVQFHFGTFFYQLAAHMFLPLFPCMVNMAGQVTTATYTWTTPVLFYVMLLTYGLCGGEQRAGMQGALIIPLVYYIQHRIVISMKYGSLSRTEYKKFMECRDKELCVSYRNQMQLGSAWLSYNSEVIHFELAAASARIGARINDINICICNPDCSPSALNQLRAWNAFLRGHEVIDFDSPPCKQLRLRPDGSYTLSVYDFCEGILMKAGKSYSENAILNHGVINLFNIINLLIPLVLMGYHFDSSVSPLVMVMMTMFYVSSTVLNYVYARTFYGLLFIAIVDVYRQLSMMSDLNCMIRLTDLMLYAELSSLMTEVTDEEQRRVDQRVAEIISIRGINTTQYVAADFEDPDQDAPLMPPADSDARHIAAFKAASLASLNNPSQTPGNTPCVIGERIYKDNEAHLLPRISFDESHNIVAWTHARLVLQNYGERFHFRLELYVSAAMTMLLIMMAAGLLHLSLATDRLALFLQPWCIQTLLSVSMCFLFLVVIMQTGASVNAKMEQHSQTMCSHALRLSRKAEHLRVHLLTESDPIVREEMESKIEKLTAVGEKLEGLRGVIEINTEIKPFKVFGFTAQSSLTVSILTTAFSFYAIIFSLLSHTDGQAIQTLAG